MNFLEGVLQFFIMSKSKGHGVTKLKSLLSCSTRSCQLLIPYALLIVYIECIFLI